MKWKPSEKKIFRVNMEKKDEKYKNECKKYMEHRKSSKIFQIISPSGGTKNETEAILEKWSKIF